jgi:4'-phosphopantetheinyl transferase
MRLQAIASITRREQFLAGRWLAKNMLVEARGGSPEDWHIDADAQKKPSVMGHDLELSIAHSGPFVACCISDHTVGIDVERIDRVRPVVDVATLVCSGHEQTVLHGLQGNELTQHFYQLWTCKEARLKQLGAAFDMNALRAIQIAPTEGAEAQVGTWYFLGRQNVVLSLAAGGLSRLQARWPAHWVAGPTQWHRYI